MVATKLVPQLFMSLLFAGHISSQENNCAPVTFGVGVVPGFRDPCSEGLVLNTRSDMSCSVACGAGFIPQTGTVVCPGDARPGDSTSGMITCGACSVYADVNDQLTTCEACDAYICIRGSCAAGFYNFNGRTGSCDPCSNICDHYPAVTNCSTNSCVCPNRRDGRGFFASGSNETSIGCTCIDTNKDDEANILYFPTFVSGAHGLDRSNQLVAVLTVAMPNHFYPTGFTIQECAGVACSFVEISPADVAYVDTVAANLDSECDHMYRVTFPINDHACGFDKMLVNGYYEYDGTVHISAATQVSGVVRTVDGPVRFRGRLPAAPATGEFAAPNMQVTPQPDLEAGLLSAVFHKPPLDSIWILTLDMYTHVILPYSFTPHVLVKFGPYPVNEAKAIQLSDCEMKERKTCHQKWRFILPDVICAATSVPVHYYMVFTVQCPDCPSNWSPFTGEAGLSLQHTAEMCNTHFDQLFLQGSLHLFHANDLPDLTSTACQVPSGPDKILDAAVQLAGLAYVSSEVVLLLSARVTTCMRTLMGRQQDKHGYMLVSDDMNLQWPMQVSNGVSPEREAHDACTSFVVPDFSLYEAQPLETQTYSILCIVEAVYATHAGSVGRRVLALSVENVENNARRHVLSVENNPRRHVLTNHNSRGSVNLATTVHVMAPEDYNSAPNSANQTDNTTQTTSSGPDWRWVGPVIVIAALCLCCCMCAIAMRDRKSMKIQHAEEVGLEMEKTDLAEHGDADLIERETSRVVQHGFFDGLADVDDHAATPVAEEADVFVPAPRGKTLRNGSEEQASSMRNLLDALHQVGTKSSVKRLVDDPEAGPAAASEPDDAPDMTSNQSSQRPDAASSWPSELPGVPDAASPRMPRLIVRALSSPRAIGQAIPSSAAHMRRQVSNSGSGDGRRARGRASSKYMTGGPSKGRFFPQDRKHIDMRQLAAEARLDSGSSSDFLPYNKPDGASPVQRQTAQAPFRDDPVSFRVDPRDDPEEDTIKPPSPPQAAAPSGVVVHPKPPSPLFGMRPVTEDSVEVSSSNPPTQGRRNSVSSLLGRLAAAAAGVKAARVTPLRHNTQDPDSGDPLPSAVQQHDFLQQQLQHEQDDTAPRLSDSPQIPEQKRFLARPQRQEHSSSGRVASSPKKRSGGPPKKKAGDFPLKKSVSQEMKKLLEEDGGDEEEDREDPEPPRTS